MIGDVIGCAVCVMLSLVVIVVCAVMRPTHASCPGGWWLDRGVNPDGHYECAPAVVGPDWTGTSDDPGWIPPERVRGRVYCTGGARAISLNDGRTVGCQR